MLQMAMSSSCMCFNGKWKKKKEMKKKRDGKRTCDTIPRLIILFKNETKIS